MMENNELLAQIEALRAQRDRATNETVVWYGKYIALLEQYKAVTGDDPTKGQQS